jgi:hypothetical protein
VAWKEFPCGGDSGGRRVHRRMGSAPLRRALPIPLLLAVTAPNAAAQLRPLEPFEWRMYEATAAVATQAGASVFTRQRASLAGTEGTLVEAGTFRLFWRTGRVVFEGAGTLQRFFREERSFAQPDPRVSPAADGRRRDRGDYLLVSTIRLTPAGAPLLGMVRFGTRLPTPDNRQGLERDMTDFFALAGARWTRGPVLVGVETGVAINGTRDLDYEQRDVMPYTVRVETRLGPVTPSVTVTGDVWGPPHIVPRGNEPLGEARLGVRTTGRRWLSAEVVAGFREFSPGHGLRLSAGADWGAGVGSRR